MEFKRNATQSGFIKHIIIGAVISLLLLPMVTLLFCAVCYNVADPLGKSGIFALAALAFSGAFGGVFSSVYGKRFGIGYPFLIAAICCAVIFAIGIFSSDASLLSRLMNLFCYLVPFVLFAGIFKIKPSKSRGSKRFSHR